MAGALPETHPIRLTARERKAKALELRKSGMSHADIAQAIGVSSPRVTQILQEELRKLAAQAAADAVHVRALHRARLEAIVEAQWERRFDPENANTIARALDQIAKLDGLNAPTQSEVFGKGGAPLVPPVIPITFANGGPGDASSPVGGPSPQSP